MRSRSIEQSRAASSLPLVLSVIAGSVDVIGFLGLGGLFTAHITGNLVVLAAKVVAGEPAPISYLFAVPVFMAALALTKLLGGGLEQMRIASLVPFLFLQAILLFAFFILCLAAGRGVDPNTAVMILAGMLGVSAMAVQNALTRISLRDAPTTAVMTTNITVFTIDAGEMLFGRNAGSIAKARARAARTWPAIAGFLFGCFLGAAGEAAFGLKSLALPAGLAFVAVGLGAASALHDEEGSHWFKRRHQQ